MDHQSANNAMIPRKSWHVLLWLAAFLEQPEREAVLGDLAECSDTGGKAIANVFGLVVRRRTAILFELRLWVAVAFLILPVSLSLSVITHNRVGEGAVYSWMYLNNWDWALTKYPGYWYVLRETAMQFGIACLLLACWSWSAGFLIGRLPNAIRRASRNAFILALVCSQLGDALARFFQLWMYFHGLSLPPSLPDIHAPVTANVFYRVFFPWIVLAILVVSPALSGMRQGNRSLLLGRSMSVVLVTAATISVLTSLIQTPLLLGLALGELLWRNRNAMQVLPLLACWPIAYMIAIAFRRYQHRAAVA
jgi:hypothetical protein